MFGLNDLKNYIKTLGQAQDNQSAKLEKIHFTLTELNDNINNLIDKIDREKQEKTKKEKKK